MTSGTVTEVVLCLLGHILERLAARRALGADADGAHGDPLALDDAGDRPFRA